VTWIERADRRTRFQVLRWLPAYLRWYFYAFATTFLRRPPSTVAMKDSLSPTHSRVSGDQ
jgi:dolichol-phosphate mannosyltransferase